MHEWMNVIEWMNKWMNEKLIQYYFYYWINVIRMNKIKTCDSHPVTFMEYCFPIYTYNKYKLYGWSHQSFTIKNILKWKSYFIKNVTEKHYQNHSYFHKFLVKQLSTHNDLPPLKYKKKLFIIYTYKRIFQQWLQIKLIVT